MEIPNELLEILHKVRKVVVLTGAGVSAESGIATFRDPNGLWTKMNPAELASVQGFMSNPKLVWSWYEHRRDIISSTKPNPGHYSIAEMQEIFTDFTLITQNVDRLHQAAGSKNVIELHGNIIDNHCQKCKKPFKGETSLPDEELPKCPECGGMIRPSVVWFGE
ncbi:MAG TPA: Sir2 family NAD-dependent protein deacetylase, partial [Candidatus Kapabacteria bacterium]|nr:Sir2 family NAD-dependent protein deacetylase [Candidatus Kapabacteria bacterium]